MALHVGFTGTRKGLTGVQVSNLRNVLVILRPDGIHIGDCIGGDAEAHYIATELRIRTIGHPPENSSHRAFCKYDSTWPPQSYENRNKTIVSLSHLLIACPGPGPNKGGTWNTVGYAREKGIPRIFIFPSGIVERVNPEDPANDR